jgi:hypothetical protein
MGSPGLNFGIVWPFFRDKFTYLLDLIAVYTVMEAGRDGRMSR